MLKVIWRLFALGIRVIVPVPVEAPKSSNVLFAVFEYEKFATTVA
jgi:hypothetical protein